METRATTRRETSLQVLAGANTSLLRNYPKSEHLEGKLADRFGVEPQRVVVTAGADDALDRCCRAYLETGFEMILPVPGFEMLHRFAANAGGAVVPVTWQGDFPTDEVISKIGSATTLIAMVTPNNPSGGIATAEDLEAVAGAARDQALVIVDQVYAEYADVDLTEVALRLDNVILVRSFSKAWGLAGCRVGYAVAPVEIADVLRSAGNPYPTSGLSLAIAAAQLETGTESLEEHVRQIKTERATLATRLGQLGIEVPDSQGNFLLPDFGTRTRFVFEALRAQGVLVRWFAHREGLETRLRITLPGNTGEFQRLIAALEICLDPQALLFDMDGVLADVSESYDLAIIATARDFDTEISATDIEAEKVAGDASNDWELTRRLLAGRGVEKSLAEITRRFQKHYLGSANGTGLRQRERPLVPISTLASWAGRLPLGVVTGRPRAEADWFLERAGMSPLVQVLVALEDALGKPDPAPIELAMTKLGVQRGWMVGDTPDDVRAALGAGVLPVGVPAPGGSTERRKAALLAAGAAAVLERPTDLEELLP